MSYDIRQQGGSFLVMELRPDEPVYPRAERLLAVCGNGDDASRILAGLMLLDLTPAKLSGILNRTGGRDNGRTTEPAEKT